MQTVKFDGNTNKLHLSKILKPSKLDGGEFELHTDRFERHTQPCDDQILSALFGQAWVGLQTNLIISHSTCAQDAIVTYQTVDTVDD